MISNIISGQISAALVGYLGDYVKPKCFDPKTIKTDILKNSITLHNLELKEQLFEGAGLSLKLDRGIIGQLKCSWSRNVFFGTEPVTISVDKVFLIFKPQNDGADLERASHLASKHRQLAAFEASHLKDAQQRDARAAASASKAKDGNGSPDGAPKSDGNGESSAKDSGNEGFLARLLGKLLANLRVNITDVHIRFEDGLSTPLQTRGDITRQETFAVGAMVKSIKLHSTNSLWQEQIVENTKRFHKVFRVEEFAVYLDPNVAPADRKGGSGTQYANRARRLITRTRSEYGRATPSEWQFMEFTRVATWMSPLHELLATASRENNDGRQTFGRVKMHFPQAPHRYIVYPVDCNVQLRVNNDPEQPDVPKRTIQVVSHTVLIGFDDEQYRQLLYVSANAKFSSLRRRFMHLRPLCSVLTNPRAWWHFAARVVLKERGFSARNICGEQAYQTKFAAAKKEYTDCWVRKKILDKMRHDQQVSASRARRGVFASLASGIFGSKMSVDEEQTGKLLEEVNAKVDALEKQMYLRYEDIILFRSLASHRLLGRMQEREKAQRMERRAARATRRGHRRGAGGGGGGGSSSRSRSSAESSSSADENEAEGQDQNANGDTNLEDNDDFRSKSSGGMRSTLYRWTAGWIWGRADSSGETRADDGKDDNWDATRADLEKLLRETADVSTPSSQAASAAFADGPKKSGRDSAKKAMSQRRKKRVDTPKTTCRNEVVILHIFVEHGQLQLLNAPRSEAASQSGFKKTPRRTLRTIPTARPVSFLSMQFSEFSLEKRDESAGTLRSSTRVSLKSLSVTDLTSESELFAHIFLSQSQASLAQQQIQWVPRLGGKVSATSRKNCEKQPAGTPAAVPGSRYAGDPGSPGSSPDKTDKRHHRPSEAHRGANDNDGDSEEGDDFSDESADDIAAAEAAEGQDDLVVPSDQDRPFHLTSRHRGGFSGTNRRSVILPPFSSASPDTFVSFANFFENNSRMLDGYGDGELLQYEIDDDGGPSGSGGVEDRPLFYFCSETFDEAQNVDGAVTMEMLETQIIYSRDCFTRVSDFFAQTVQVPGAMMLVDQLELAAIEQYNDLKERSRKKLDFYYDHNASFALNISISAPVLVIPDKANDATWSTAIVVDLGRLEIMSDQQLQQPTVANDADKSESVTVFDAGDSIGVLASSLVDTYSGKVPEGGRPRAAGAQNSYDEDAGEDTSSTGRSDDRANAERSENDDDSEEEDDEERTFDDEDTFYDRYSVSFAHIAVILRHRDSMALSATETTLSGRNMGQNFRHTALYSPLGTPRARAGQVLAAAGGLQSMAAAGLLDDHMFLIHPVNFKVDVKLSRIAYDTTLVRAKVDVNVSRLRVELSSAKYTQLMGVVEANFAPKQQVSGRTPLKTPHAPDKRTPRTDRRFAEVVIPGTRKNHSEADLLRVLRAVEAFRQGYEESRRERKRRLRRAKLRQVSEESEQAEISDNGRRQFEKTHRRELGGEALPGTLDAVRVRRRDMMTTDQRSQASSEAAVGDVVRQDVVAGLASAGGAAARPDDDDSGSASGSATRDDSSYCSVSFSSDFSSDSDDEPFDVSVLDDSIVHCRMAIQDIENKLRLLASTAPALSMKKMRSGLGASGQGFQSGDGASRRPTVSANRPSVQSTHSVANSVPTTAASAEPARATDANSDRGPGLPFAANETVEELRARLVRLKRDLSHFLRAKASSDPQRYLKRVARWYDKFAPTEGVSGGKRHTDASSFGSFGLNRGGGGPGSQASFFTGSDAGQSRGGSASVASALSRSTFNSRRTVESQFGRRRTHHTHSTHHRSSRRFGLERRQRGIHGDLHKSYQHTRQWLALSLVFENVGIAVLRDKVILDDSMDKDMPSDNNQSGCHDVDQAEADLVSPRRSLFVDPPPIQPIVTVEVEKVATIRMRNFAFLLNTFGSVAEFKANVGSLEIVDYLEANACPLRSQRTGLDAHSSQSEHGQQFPDPAYILLSDTSKTFITCTGLYRFAPDFMPVTAATGSAAMAAGIQNQKDVLRQRSSTGTGKIASTEADSKTADMSATLGQKRQAYRQVLDLKVAVADAEAVLNQETLCALLEVIQPVEPGTDARSENSSKSGLKSRIPSQASTPRAQRKGLSPNVQNDFAGNVEQNASSWNEQQPLVDAPPSTGSGQPGQDTKQAKNPTATHGCISQPDQNVLNCMFTLGQLALTIQHSARLHRSASSQTKQHVPLLRAVASNVSLHYRDNVYSFGVSASLGDLVVLDLRPSCSSLNFRNPGLASSLASQVSAVVLAPRYPEERRKLFEFMVHEDIKPQAVASTSKQVGATTMGGAKTASTSAASTTEPLHVPKITEVCVKRQCRVELRPIELVVDGPFLSQVVDTLANGAIMETLRLQSVEDSTETVNRRKPKATESEILGGADVGEDADADHEDEGVAVDPTDPALADAALYSSYTAYPFTHPSRSSYDLAVLDPLIRIPALITSNGPATSAGSGGALGGEDDSCCLFFNFKHFKVQLKDAKSWRRVDREQRRLVAQVAAIQLYKLRQQSLLPRNTYSNSRRYRGMGIGVTSGLGGLRGVGMRRAQQRGQASRRIDNIFSTAFDVGFRFSTVKSLTRASEFGATHSETRATVSTDSFLDVSEVNVKLTEHWALLLYTTWRTNISRLDFADESPAKLPTEQNETVHRSDGGPLSPLSPAANSEATMVDTIFIFQCVAPGVVLHLTKPLSTASNDAPLSSARDYRPTKDRDIAVFAVRSLDFSLTRAADTLLSDKNKSETDGASVNSSDITIKGTVGNIMFDYLRSKDDLSWASSLFVLPTDQGGLDADEGQQMPTRLTLLSGELDDLARDQTEGPQRNSRATEESRLTDVPANSDNEDDGDEEDEDEESDDAAAATAAGTAAAAATTTTPFISAEVSISDTKTCDAVLQLNAPRLIVAPQAYMALVDYAVFLVEKGHRWSMGDFDSQNDPTNAGSASETPQPDEPREQPVQTRDTTTSAANSVGEEAGDPSAHISSRGRPRGLPHDDRMQSRLGNWFDQVDLRLQVLDSKLWFVDNSNPAAAAAESSAADGASKGDSVEKAVVKRVVLQRGMPAVSTTVLLSFESVSLELCGHDVDMSVQSINHAQLSVDLRRLALEFGIMDRWKPYASNAFSTSIVPAFDLSGAVEFFRGVDSALAVNTLLQQRLHRFEKGSVLNLRMQERSKPFCKIAFDVPVLQLSVSLDTFPALSYVVDAVVNMAADANYKLEALSQQLKMQTLTQQRLNAASRGQSRMVGSSAFSGQTTSTVPRVEPKARGDPMSEQNVSGQSTGLYASTAAVPPFLQCRFDVEGRLNTARMFLVYDVRRESTAMALVEIRDLAVDVLTQPLRHGYRKTSEPEIAIGVNVDVESDSPCLASSDLGDIALETSFSLSVYSRNLRAQWEAAHHHKGNPPPSSAWASRTSNAKGGRKTTGSQSSAYPFAAELSAATGWEPVVEPFHMSVGATYTVYVKPEPSPASVWEQWFTNPGVPRKFLFPKPHSCPMGTADSAISTSNPWPGRVEGTQLSVAVAVDRHAQVNVNVTEALAENLGRFLKIYEARQRNLDRANSSEAVFLPSNPLTSVATASARRVLDEQRRQAAAVIAAETSPLRLRNDMDCALRVLLGNSVAFSSRSNFSDNSSPIKSAVKTNTNGKKWADVASFHAIDSILDELVLMPGQEKSIAVDVAREATHLIVLEVLFSQRSLTGETRGDGNQHHVSHPEIAEGSGLQEGMNHSHLKLAGSKGVCIEIRDTPELWSTLKLARGCSENGIRGVGDADTVFCRFYMHQEDPVQPDVSDDDDENDDFFLSPQYSDFTEDPAAGSKTPQHQIRICSFEPVLTIKNCLAGNCLLAVGKGQELAEITQLATNSKNSKEISTLADDTIDVKQESDVDQTLSAQFASKPVIIARGETHIHTTSTLDLSFCIRCPGFGWSAPVHLEEKPLSSLPLSFALPVRLLDEHGLDLSAVARVRACRSGALSIALYVPYIVRNKTGLPLLVRCGGMSNKIAAGQGNTLRLTGPKQTNGPVESSAGTGSVPPMDDEDPHGADLTEGPHKTVDLFAVVAANEEAQASDDCKQKADEVVMLGYADPGQSQSIRLCVVGPGIVTDEPSSLLWCRRDISLATPRTHEVPVLYHSVLVVEGRNSVPTFSNADLAAETQFRTPQNKNEEQSTSPKASEKSPTNAASTSKGHSAVAALSEVVLGVEVCGYRGNDATNPGGRFTREVVIVPRYTIINELPVAIRAQQVGAANRAATQLDRPPAAAGAEAAASMQAMGTSDPGSSDTRVRHVDNTSDVRGTEFEGNETVDSPREVMVEQLLLIEPGARAPFHWFDRDGPRLFQCTFDEPGWAWSGGVALAEAVTAAESKAAAAAALTSSTSTALSGKDPVGHQTAGLAPQTIPEVAEPYVVFLRLHHAARNQTYVAQLTVVVRGAAVAVVLRPEENSPSILMSNSLTDSPSTLAPSKTGDLDSPSTPRLLGEGSMINNSTGGSTPAAGSEPKSIRTARPLPFRIENKTSTTLVIRQRDAATEASISWLPNFTVINKAAAMARRQRMRQSPESSPGTRTDSASGANELDCLFGTNIAPDIVRPYSSFAYAPDEPAMPPVLVVDILGAPLVDEDHHASSTDGNDTDGAKNGSDMRSARAWLQTKNTYRMGTYSLKDDSSGKGGGVQVFDVSTVHVGPRTLVGALGFGTAPKQYRFLVDAYDDDQAGVRVLRIRDEAEVHARRDRERAEADYRTKLEKSLELNQGTALKRKSSGNDLRSTDEPASRPHWSTTDSSLASTPMMPSSLSPSTDSASDDRVAAHEAVSHWTSEAVRQQLERVEKLEVDLSLPVMCISLVGVVGHRRREVLCVWAHDARFAGRVAPGLRSSIALAVQSIQVDNQLLATHGCPVVLQPLWRVRSNIVLPPPKDIHKGRPVKHQVGTLAPLPKKQGLQQRKALIPFRDAFVDSVASIENTTAPGRAKANATALVSLAAMGSAARGERRVVEFLLDKDLRQPHVSHVLSLDARLESLALQVDFELWRVLLLDVAPRFRNALERADSSVSAADLEEARRRRRRQRWNRRRRFAADDDDDALSFSDLHTEKSGSDSLTAAPSFASPRRTQLVDSAKSAADNDVARGHTDGGVEPSTEVFLEQYRVSPFFVDVSVSNVGSVAQVESVWVAELLPILEFFPLRFFGWDHFEVHFAGVLLQQRRARKMPSVIGMAARAALSSFFMPRRLYTRVRAAARAASTLFSDPYGRSRGHQLAAGTVRVLNGIRATCYATEHWLKVTAEDRDVGSWPLVLRPFHLLSQARRRRDNERRGVSVPSRYTLSAGDILSFPFINALRWWLRPRGGTLVRTVLSPVTLSTGFVLGACGSVLGCVVKVSATSCNWIMNRIVDVHHHWASSASGFTTLSDNMDAISDDSSLLQAQATADGSSEKFPRQLVSHGRRHMENADLMSMMPHESPRRGDQRVRQPRFFPTPGTLLRPYVNGEANGPQLLARLDGGRLRGSDEFVAHEQCPPTGIKSHTTTAGLNSGSARAASLFCQQIVLLTNRRLLCVRHRRVNERLSLEEEVERRSTPAAISAVQSSDDWIIEWEIPLFDIVRVDVPNEDDSVIADTADIMNDPISGSSGTDPEAVGPLPIFNVVYLPATRTGRVDEGLSEGFSLLRQPVVCRSVERVNVMAKHINRQLELVNPFIFE